MLTPHFLKNPLIWQFALVGYWLALFISTHVPSNVPLAAE